MARKITINRAPVLTLWAAVVAERSGHDPDAALTLGRAVAGLNAQSKGRRLGIFEEAQDKKEAVKMASSEPTRVNVSPCWAVLFQSRIPNRVCGQPATEKLSAPPAYNAT